MATISTNYQLPAPVLADGANIETAVKPLRDKLDTILSEAAFPTQTQRTAGDKVVRERTGVSLPSPLPAGSRFYDSHGTQWRSSGTVWYLEGGVLPRAARFTNSSVSNGSSWGTLPTIADGSSAENDPWNMHTLSYLEFILPYAGVWNFMVQHQWGVAFSFGDQRGVRLTNAGSEVVSEQSNDASPSGWWQNLNFIVPVNDGNRLTLEAYANMFSVGAGVPINTYTRYMCTMLGS